MPPQSRAAQGFAGAAVEIDLIRKGIMTCPARPSSRWTPPPVEIDLIRKGIMTPSSQRECKIRFHCGNRPDSQRDYDRLELNRNPHLLVIVEIDLIRKGIKTLSRFQRSLLYCTCVEIDLIHKGIKTRPCRYRTASTNKGVETDLTLKAPLPHPKERPCPFPHASITSPLLPVRSCRPCWRPSC